MNFRNYLLIIYCLLVFLNQINSQTFIEVSDNVGINYNFPGNDRQEIGAGVTVFDVNNDGWDDIYQSCGIFPSKLWINEKGIFRDATIEYRLNILDSLFIQGVSAADYDNDGFEDLFIGNAGNLIFMGDKFPPVVLRNVNGKYFEPVFQETFSTVGNYPFALWGDVNNDGYVDLFLINYITSMANELDSSGNNNISYIPKCNGNLLYINKQGKGFTESTKEYNLENFGCGLAGIFTDYDLDNDMDLILLNDFGRWNHLGNKIYRNDYPQPGFTDVSEETGFYEEFYGMSVGPGDVNNDGRLDYYLTNIGRNYFYMNEVDGFKEQGLSKGIDLTIVKDSLKGTSWSGLFFDADNDGDVDLFVSKGFLNSLEKVVVLDENKFFLNGGEGEFVDFSISSGINDSLVNRGAALIDYNHDGKMDVVSGLIKMSRGDFANLDQKVKLYKNSSTNSNNWIGFKLIGGDGVNSSCLGCRITFESGGKLHIREVDSGSGHSSQSSKVLYFGLQKEREIQNVKIHWIGGEVTEIKKIKAGKVYTVTMDGKTQVLY